MPLTAHVLAYAIALSLALNASAHNHGEKSTDKRQLGTHEHGVGQLNLALEGKILAIELISPAANIVGFEHEPGNDQERAALASGEAKLKNVLALFALDPSAGCSVSRAEVARSAPEDDHDHDHSHDHDHDHAHEGHEEAKGSHSDLVLNAELSCTRADALKTITVNLFDTFPLTEKLRAVFIGKAGQTAADLDKSARTITLPK